MSNLRIAVVGVGSLGQHHAAKLSAFEDVDLVAVVDPGEQQGRAVAERLKTEWRPDCDGLEDSLDGVVIAAPTSFHWNSAQPFLKNSVATFVEKPLASNVQQAAELVELAQQHSCLLQVGHIERFNPAFQAAASVCEAETPLYIRCQRVSPYSFRSTDIGVVHDLMIHDLDLVLSLTGEMPVSVDAFGAVGIGPHEDMCVARLKMPAGTVVDLTASRMNPTAARQMQVWHSGGCANVDMHTRTLESWAPRSDIRSNPALITAIAAATEDPRTLKDRVFDEWIECRREEIAGGDQMEAELRNFVDCIRSQDSPIVSGKDGLKAMQVADQVLESLNAWSYQTGQTKSASRKAA